MLPRGRGSDDRYGVWMRGVGLSATIRQAHRPALSRRWLVTGRFRHITWRWTWTETVLLRRKATPCPIDGRCQRRTDERVGPGETPRVMAGLVTAVAHGSADGAGRSR